MSLDHSPFATTRLPALSPTQRLQLHARSSLAYLRRIYPGILIGLGLALLAWSLTLLLAPRSVAAQLPLAEPAYAQAAVVAPTPPLAVPTAAPPLVIIAAWSPAGPTYGSLMLDGPLVLIEQYQGWGRFRLPHMAQDLWAPIAQLAPALTAEQLAAAPEIAPTASLATPAPPPSAPVIVAVPPPPADLHLVDGAGTLVQVVNEPGRSVYEIVQPPEATPFPTPYYGEGGRTGGSWDD